jgi:DNA-binding NarL/FixJ family response regulator
MVDDDPFTRSMLASSLQVIGCFVATATSASEALRLARGIDPKSAPNVALLDLDLGEGPTGIDLATTLREDFPNIGIIILSTYKDPRLLGRKQQVLPPGSLYLVKQTVADSHILASALRDAISNAHEKDVRKTATPLDSTPLKDLSDGQLELMRLVASGHSNSEIARRQWMTEAAVEKAISRLCKKIALKFEKDKNQRVMVALAYHELTGNIQSREN